MDYEHNEYPQSGDWTEEALGASHEESIGPDEHAIQSAGLIHPDDMELEMILAEHREENPEPEDTWDEMPLDVLPEEPEAEIYNDAVSSAAEMEVTRFFAFQAAGDLPPTPNREAPVHIDATEAPPTEYPVDYPAEEIYAEEFPSEEGLPAEELPEEALLEEGLLDEALDLPIRKGRPKMKKGYGLLGIPHLVSTLIWLVLILLIGISLGRTLWLCCADLMAFGKEPQEVVITITDEDTIDTISQTLAEEGLIRYPGLFKKFAELTGKVERISPGTFTLNSRLDYNAMINGMTAYAPAREEVTVMFPEGYTCAQIFKLLEENGVCTVAELEEYAANGELEEHWFLEGVKRGDKYCLEGYLFPDTYDFYTNDEPGRVLEKFLDAFDARFTDIMRERLVTINEDFAQWLADEGFDQEYIDAHPITIREVVIIASLIEKESSGGEESYDISSVIYNRLTDSSEPPYLGIDAALLYALGGNIDPETGESMPLTNEDLQLDNPYNTRLYAGLPPGPIANPGQESLNAAVNPNDTNYYYYALDPSTGKHEFFRTYAEHLRFLESIGY